MENYVWVSRSQEWIKANPNKGSMYKFYTSDGEPPATASAETRKKYKKRVKSEIENPPKGADAGIYVIICNSSRSVYVGQSVNMEVRMRNHKMLICGDRSVPMSTYVNMRKDFNKYGIESFEFIKYLKLPFDDGSMLIEEEQKAICKFMDDGYNLYNTSLNLGMNIIYCPSKFKDRVKEFISSLQ
ncbi:MAG: GIY-YIG nuclease family protein [Bacteroidota bacterium]